MDSRMLTRRQMMACTAVGASGSFRRGENFAPFQLKVGDSVIEVRFGDGDLATGRDEIRQWISNAAHAVMVYFGRFPVGRAIVEVQPVEGRSGVLDGVTFGEENATKTTLRVGSQTSSVILQQDWTMTHELTHLAVPNVPRRHHWFEEGIATYVEPIARAQAGTLAVEQVWSDMVRDMPQGNPRSGDRGLDNTRSWANTYWGGAIFCLNADVEYRIHTGNKRGLQDALRGIVRAGGNIEREWPITKVLQTGDDSVGVPVLSELYGHMKDNSVTVDFPALWRKLGIEGNGSILSFHPDAEYAAIREAITAVPGR